jgi:hypothetical protein
MRWPDGRTAARDAEHLSWRLQQLPAAHPSAPGYRRGQAVGDGGEDPAPAERDTAEAEGMPDAELAEQGSGGAADSGERNSLAARLACADRRAHRPRTAGVPAPVSEREPYRPWFTTASDPWFTAGPGGRPG